MQNPLVRGVAFVNSLLIIRFAFILLLAASGWYLRPFELADKYAAAAGLLCGLVISESVVQALLSVMMVAIPSFLSFRAQQVQRRSGMAWV